MYIQGRRIRDAASGAAKWVINLLYPEVCPVCMEILRKGGSGICMSCRKKLNYIKNPRCLKCGKQIDSEEESFCCDCTKRRHAFVQGIGVWGYTKEISRSIYAFKYHNQRDFARIYAEELYRCCGNIINEWHAQVLIPVPLHKDRMRKRGYNQAQLIAKELGRLINLPTDETLLVRNRKTQPQKELNDKERVKNLENAFKIQRNVVEYKKAILVDDIYTTGTTVDACAKVLIAHGVESVYFVTLCIGRGF